MILVLDCGSKKTPDIVNCIDEYQDVMSIPILDFKESDLENKMGVVISGAPLLITEINMRPYLDQVTWLKTTKIPVLGICFGHQLIGITFGSYGSKMKEARDFETIEIFESSPLFERMPSEFEMQEDHCETISIPPEFNLIGSSDGCVNEVMQHQTLPIYGVQFHPEVSGTIGGVLFDNFCRICTNGNNSH